MMAFTANVSNILAFFYGQRLIDFPYVKVFTRDLETFTLVAKVYFLRLTFFTANS